MKEEDEKNRFRCCDTNQEVINGQVLEATNQK